MEFILAQPPSEMGVHVSTIAQGVKVPGQELSVALDNLLDDGHVFSTCDESHVSAAI